MPEQLMQAFRARDADSAFRIWRKHLHNTGKAVMQSLEATVKADRAR